MDIIFAPVNIFYNVFYFNVCFSSAHKIRKTFYFSINCWAEIVLVTVSCGIVTSFKARNVVPPTIIKTIRAVAIFNKNDI